MSRRTRILLALLAVYALGMAALLYQLLADLDPRYRESAEEGLIETAQLMATVIEQEVEQGALPTDRIAAIFRDVYARRFSAQVYQLHKTRVELRAYVTNRHGQVVYDSTGRHLGQDYAGWRDVRNTLRGEYGARTTRDVASDPGSTVMYVAAPIRWEGEIVGVVSLGKPVQSFGQFVAAARGNILYVGLMSALSVLLLAVLLSFLLMRPLGITTDLLAALGTAWWHDERGRRRFSPRRAWRALRAQSRAALQEARDAIAGRNYVQDYVRQLAHELKSPISAVRAAAELLQEPGLPPEQGRRFAANIARESQRLQDVVERMMELSALESRRLLREQQRVPLAPLLHELATGARARAPGLRIEVTVLDDVAVEGDPFLLRRAVGNLLDNAVDFSTPGGAEGDGADIVLTLAREGRWALVRVRDHGPGVPAFAQDKVFDKFFSLARPRTHKKSTGLGLAFVREIAVLHQGGVTLANAHPRQEPGFDLDRSRRGALAVLRLPAL
ncbi:two-component system sensor histidine kinase CreC [Ottowia sp.]|uniref:two-component system sensor histidine kinase CreC n=1 Tax=Ottowia sp. TaxID=1898956 RepID=UPI0025E5FD6F|nr:two-component system sensor histidine kinase CreC [Ottowia sp.]MBK6614918.1 two-component system sensor histidine kinase CreC [Ottowia sp.]MBK6746002.1 two-component system sensor histidine kinase CreC [Ottowia sp.]